MFSVARVHDGRGGGRGEKHGDDGGRRERDVGHGRGVLEKRLDEEETTTFTFESGTFLFWNGLCCSYWCCLLFLSRARKKKNRNESAAALRKTENGMYAMKREREREREGEGGTSSKVVGSF